MRSLENGFWKKHSISGLIGIVDGSHIPCTNTFNGSRNYINRKGFPSIILQGTVDAEGLFIDVEAGFPGRMADGGVFADSTLKAFLESTDIVQREGLYIIGDAAYPIAPFCVVEYSDRETQAQTASETQQRRMFNRILASARV